MTPKLQCRIGIVSPKLEIPAWLSANNAQAFVDTINKFWDIPLDVTIDKFVSNKLTSNHGIRDPFAWQLHEQLAILLGTPADPLKRIGMLLCDRYGSKPSVFGVMFDPGFPFKGSPQNDAVEAKPREGCAIFLDRIKQSGNDYDLQSLRSMIHEFGHILNLEHVENSSNIMQSSKVDPQQPFDDPVWKLTANHKDRLSDISTDNKAIWPGGNRFGDNGFETGDNPWRDMLRSIFGLEMTIDAQRRIFHYYEPIELDIKITLVGGVHESISIPDMVDPGYRAFRLWIEEPGGARRTLHSPRHYCAMTETLSISPDRPFLRDISLFGQSGGYTFRRAGIHRLWAELALSPTEKLTSPAIEVELLTRRHDDDARRVLLTRYASQVLLYHRLRLRTGSRLQAFVEEHPQDPAAPGIRYAIARASDRQGQAKGADVTLSDEFAALSQSPLLGSNQRRHAADLAEKHRPSRGFRSSGLSASARDLGDAPKKGRRRRQGRKTRQQPDGSR